MPAGCTSVDVFLVGGGAGGADVSAGAGGRTKTFKKSNDGHKDGNEIIVTPGQSIKIIVGAGGHAGVGNPSTSGAGGYSQFMNSNYQVAGGDSATSDYNVGPVSNGGSGGCGWNGKAGSDGSDGTGTYAGAGQGYTTRDFGEVTGKRNAGGGGCNRGSSTGRRGGVSDYTEGSGGTMYSNSPWARSGSGGGGYGGGGGGASYSTSASGGGGDGTVLIRYYAYE